MKKIKDHYFLRAKREGFAARSAYKLEEIDRRHRLLRPGMRVLDLGCAPGSWLQYAAARVGESGTVVGVDLQAVSKALPPQARALTGDVFAMHPGELLAGILPAEDFPAGTAPFDAVLSDMAPKTTGIKQADAARCAELVRLALALAVGSAGAPHGLLKPGGALLAKVFQGGEMEALRREFGAAFDRVRTEKPKASRGESVEVFLLGLGRRG